MMHGRKDIKSTIIITGKFRYGLTCLVLPLVAKFWIPIEILFVSHIFFHTLPVFELFADGVCVYVQLWTHIYRKVTPWHASAGTEGRRRCSLISFATLSLSLSLTHTHTLYIYIYVYTSTPVYSSLAVCLTTGPKSLPKRAPHRVRSRASSFKWEYPLLSSSSKFPRLLPRLPVTYISPFIFPSITRCRRQFLRKMWPIQLALRLLISCRIFLCSLTLSNTPSFLTWSVQLIFSIILQHHISKLSRYFWSTARSVQVSAPYKAMLKM